MVFWEFGYDCWDVQGTASALAVICALLIHTSIHQSKYSFTNLYISLLTIVYVFLITFLKRLH